MRIAEQLRRLLLLFALLLGIAAAPILFVNAEAAVALLVLAGLGIGLAVAIRARPVRAPQDSFNVEDLATLEVSAALPADDEVTQMQTASTTVITLPTGEAYRTADHASADPLVASAQPATTAWLWLIGAFLAGVSIGVLTNRILPAPYANPSSAQYPAPVEPLSPLVSPIGKLEATSSLIESRVIVAGEEWTVLHSVLDIGQAADIFDGKPETLMRGKSANPFIFEVRYPRPKPAGSVILHLARMSDFEITITAVTTDDETLTFGKAYVEELVDPVLEFEVPGGARPLRSVRVAILDRRAPPQEGFHTHVREFALR